MGGRLLLGIGVVYVYSSPMTETSFFMIDFCSSSI